MPLRWATGERGNADATVGHYRDRGHSPLGLSAPELCEALLAGKVGIRPAPWASADNPDLFGAVDDRFDALDWADERVVAGSDGFAHFALAAVAQALAEAGLDGEGALHETRTAIVHGTSMGGLNALMRAQARR